MFYVYVLNSLKRTSFYYIGYTSNLKERIREHNVGKVVSTKHLKPYRLLYYEAFIDKKDAIAREKYLKSGWGRRSLKKLLSNYLTTN